MVSRLTEQKGLDLLLEALPGFLDGAGGWRCSAPATAGLRRTGARRPSGMRGSAVRIGYDEALAHRMMAGGDAVLVPSRFEPCGLTQLYGLRYGAVPVVARVGGLADTVIDANDAALKAGVATGVVHAPDHGGRSRDRAGAAVPISMPTRRPGSGCVRNAMRHPVGWDVSAGTTRLSTGSWCPTA